MKPMKRLCCLLLALLLPVSAPAEAELPGTGREKEIRILFVGNSLTQDSVTYVPYLLKTCFPSVRFTFCMWYYGGYTLQQQYAVFRRNGTGKMVSVADNTAGWTNHTYSVRMADLLSDYTFDIVCMQEYFNDRDTFTEADMAGWNNCRDYITEHYTGGNEPEFVTLFHSPRRNSAEKVFELTKAGNTLFLKKGGARDMIASGIAVYRAMATELDSLGDKKHLSPDGIHAQEGLPCLLEAWTVLCWVLDRTGAEPSVYGSPCRMTKEIYRTLHIPGPNPGSGLITGTDGQNLLAQESAVRAYEEGKEFVRRILTGEECP